jgi:hypothetical protein
LIFCILIIIFKFTRKKNLDKMDKKEKEIKFALIDLYHSLKPKKEKEKVL